MKKLDKKYNTHLASPLNILSSKAYKSFLAQNNDFKPGPDAKSQAGYNFDWYNRLNKETVMEDDMKSVRSIAMTEKRSIKQLNSTLEKKMKDTFKSLKSSQSVYSMKGTSYECL